MRNDEIKFLAFMALLILTSVAVLTGIYWGLARLETSYHCTSYHEATGKPTKVVGLECYVEVAPGDWHARGELRDVGVR